ncbi:MAG TPA: tRNA guanosine(34) transglycosylase Tgt [Myxococcaceae bacterium]|nr:tRNA guanosine(34) transglycosylase Tgt [Myxococcaceae bacterium]
MSEPFRFEVLATDAASSARRGRMHTPHGVVETPVFTPVGTLGTVKAVGQDDLQALGAELVLANTYHLMLRPGEELVRALGGLHRFMAWPRALITDSGGFQVFSLAPRRKITEQGVEFRSHLDGSLHLLTPERSIAIQEALGADVIMAFDECPPSTAERPVVETALARTTAWLHRSAAAWTRGASALFGIVQGGLDLTLRRRHLDEVCAVDLPGYALGGYSVGESPEAMRASVAEVAPLLPRDRPRYLMGVGTPVDLVRAVAAGVDMFDCVLPTRCARNGLLFTSEGRLVIRNATYARDERPVDGACGCYTCRTHSRAYLRHLYATGEVLALRLNTLHNLHHYLELMRRARQAISEGGFLAFAREVEAREGGDAAPP